MLKRSLLFLVSVLLIAAVLVGCNGDGNDNGGDTNVAGNPVQEFLDAYGDQLEAEMGDMADMLGATVTLEAGPGGNELIYVFTYGTELPDGMEDLLAEMLSGMDFLFEMVADEMREELDLDSFRVTVRYLDLNGNVLAAQSFDSN